MNDSISLEKLPELKESNSMQTAEFAVEQGIDVPAFNLWVKHVHKNRENNCKQ